MDRPSKRQSAQGNHRQRGVVAASIAEVATTLATNGEAMDGALKGRDHLLGKDFTIADLNVSSVLSFAVLAKLDMTATPTAQAWLGKCLGREAFKKVRSLP